MGVLLFKMLVANPKPFAPPVVLQLLLLQLIFLAHRLMLSRSRPPNEEATIAVLNMVYKSVQDDEDDDDLMMV